MHALRVNETKVTWRNAFADNYFALKSEKESKSNEKTLFSDPLQQNWLRFIKNFKK